MDSLMLRRRAINLNLDAYIDFADPVVAEVCANTWGDGVGLTRRQAMFLTSTQFGTTFKLNTDITTFDELRFFASLTQIPSGAFEGCTNLVSVTLPSSVTDIRGWAFNNCESLSNINLGNKIRYIRDGAFLNCSSLAIEINVPNIANFATYDCFKNSGIVKMTSFGAPSTLGHYGNFQNCTSLLSAVVPSTVTSIGRIQFSGCTNLQYVIMLPDTPPTIAGANFKDTGDCVVYVPYSSDHSILTAYQTEWGTNSGANTYDVPRLAELDENGNIPE